MCWCSLLILGFHFLQLFENFSLPQRQQSAEVSVAQSLLFGFIALLVQRQGFVIDKTTGPSETSQMAKLFAVGLGLEWVALPSEHPKDDASWMTKSQDLSRRVTTSQMDGEDHHC
jgi:hypothetical protein